MPISVAIVGAGPSGFYTAQALIKRGLDCRIDVIETLPTPFGLIRAGVAPDHQHTKQVSRTYERTATEGDVAYFGNVELGRDVSLAELRRMYDAVVLATGAPLDRGFSLLGGDKRGIYGAAEFVGWYNGHPAHRDLDPDLGVAAAAVIGNGNVALDVGRVLTKTAEEMRVADLPPYAATAIHRSPLTDVFMFGRRGPVEAKFTNVELREIGRLADCAPVVDPAQIPDAVTGEMSDRDRRLTERNLATLRSFAELSAEGKGKRLHFLFCSMPVEILGTDRVEGVRFERTVVEDGQAIGTGAFFEVPCGVVVAAIGYRMAPIDGVPIDGRRGIVVNTDGRVDDGLYVVGWAKRGPSGVISTNKPDGDLVAGYVADDVAAGAKPGRPALETHLADAGVAWITFDDWKEIDAAEVAAAPDGAPREKLVRVEDMLSVVGRKVPGNNGGPRKS